MVKSGSFYTHICFSLIHSVPSHCPRSRTPAHYRPGSCGPVPICAARVRVPAFLPDVLLPTGHRQCGGLHELSTGTRRDAKAGPSARHDQRSPVPVWFKGESRAHVWT